MAEDRKATRPAGRKLPAQKEGSDEKAGNGLEQLPTATPETAEPRPAVGSAPATVPQAPCRPDKGGGVH